MSFLQRRGKNPPEFNRNLPLFLVGLFGGLLLLFPLSITAQTFDRECNVIRNDTLLLCAGTLVQFGNESRYIRTDTLIVSVHNTPVRIMRDPYQHAKAFYDSLRVVASRNPLMSRMFNLLVPNSGQIADELRLASVTSDGIEQYEEFRGRKIRRIVVEQMDVFGPTVVNPGREPHTWLGRTGNKLHMTTRKGVILSNLLINEGDTIDPVIVAENAQLIRSLPYFEEAAIELLPVAGNSTEVDMFVITKDLFSFGLNLEIHSLAIWDVDVYNQNFLGLGHRVSSTVRYNSQQGSVLRISRFSYRVDNIGGTFVNAEAGLTNTLRTNSVGIKLFRDFFSVGTKVAGGLELYHQNEQKTLYSPGIVSYDLRLNRQVLWLGQAFKVGNRSRPSTLVFAAALQNTLYTRRPYVDADSNTLFHNSSQLLGNITFSKNYYYTGNYIYQFGRVEDIPYGYHLSVSFGPDAYEYSTRLYSGVSVGLARYFNRFGYVSGRAFGDGYWSNGQLNQGFAGVTMDYFSPLQTRFFNKVRHFLTLKYATGIRRFAGESFHVVKELGVGGLTASDTLYFSGNQKITANFTSVVFTPVYYLGFRLAWFTFANVAWIGPEPGETGANNLYLGFGLGCLLRNENLVLKTIQFRLGFFPGLPGNRPGVLFEFSGVSPLQFIDFRPKRPKTLLYE